MLLLKNITRTSSALLTISKGRRSGHGEFDAHHLCRGRFYIFGFGIRTNLQRLRFSACDRGETERAGHFLFA